MKLLSRILLLVLLTTLLVVPSFAQAASWDYGVFYDTFRTAPLEAEEYLNAYIDGGEVTWTEGFLHAHYLLCAHYQEQGNTEEAITYAARAGALQPTEIQLGFKNPFAEVSAEFIEHNYCRYISASLDYFDEPQDLVLMNNLWAEYLEMDYSLLQNTVLMSEPEQIIWMYIGIEAYKHANWPHPANVLTFMGMINAARPVSSSAYYRFWQLASYKATSVYARQNLLPAHLPAVFAEATNLSEADIQSYYMDGFVGLQDFYLWKSRWIDGVPYPSLANN